MGQKLKDLIAGDAQHRRSGDFQRSSSGDMLQAGSKRERDSEEFEGNREPTSSYSRSSFDLPNLEGDPCSSRLFLTPISRPWQPFLILPELCQKLKITDPAKRFLVCGQAETIPWSLFADTGDHWIRYLGMMYLPCLL